MRRMASKAWKTYERVVMDAILWADPGTITTTTIIIKIKLTIASMLPLYNLSYVLLLLHFHLGPEQAARIREKVAVGLGACFRDSGVDAQPKLYPRVRSNRSSSFTLLDLGRLIAMSSDSPLIFYLLVHVIFLSSLLL